MSRDNTSLAMEGEWVGNWTHSATAGPLREIELQSTTKAMALASFIYSANWPRIRGCPGTSTSRMVFEGDRIMSEELVCKEVRVGNVCE